MSNIRNWNIAVKGMAFDPQTGESFQLNETAKLILMLVREGRSVEDISSEVSKRFGVNYEQALTDVYEFLVHLETLDSAA
jgi:hypothetical protein